MSVVVVNHLSLTVPVVELAPIVEREFGPVFRAQPGFERFYLVQSGEQEAIAVIVWSDGETAAAGAAVVGPTIFNDHLVPFLAAPQQRSAGPAVVAID